jgi:hypothetical protein
LIHLRRTELNPLPLTALGNKQIGQQKDVGDILETVLCLRRPTGSRSTLLTVYRLQMLAKILDKVKMLLQLTCHTIVTLATRSCRRQRKFVEVTAMIPDRDSAIDEHIVQVTLR